MSFQNEDLSEPREICKKMNNYFCSVGAKLAQSLSSGWWRGTVVERRSLAGELSLSCARPAADG